ncbi:MAG: DUF3500 domain-containing protein [Verrucomicrobia bacterium]|nr:DUF3500 domain-containing protein [Verrucomicrobiota bacterium]
MKFPIALRGALALLAAAHFTTVSLRAHPAADEMAAAAAKFAATLTAEQKAKALYPDVKAEARQQWHFIPSEMVKFGRKGVTFIELSEEQRKLALALLRTGLSADGYAKATNIMSLEAVLRQIEKPGGKVDRNPIKYFVSIYGTPDPKGTWGWRFEGHHMSLVFTIVDGKAISTSPTFMGTNPAEVREGPRKGVRVLGRDEDRARQLVKSLNAEQSATAIFDKDAPKEIITTGPDGPPAKVSPLTPEGIASAKLTKDQQKQLKGLVEEFAHRIRPDLAKADLAKIEKAGWDKVHFAWAGGTERGQGHYYRVQGPTFLIEYDNTQNEANHVHSVWRDFQGDFGADLLAKHYAESHAK